MNRGSTFKWIELLQNQSIRFNDGWGLKYAEGGPSAFCPNGKFGRVRSVGYDDLARVEFDDGTWSYFSIQVICRTLAEFDPDYIEHYGEKYSPRGVLEEFIMKDLKLAWHECGYVTVDGTETCPSKEMLKRVKAKTNLEEVDDLLINNPSITRDEIISFITNNYERL
jgi:hypothetical protein